MPDSDPPWVRAGGYSREDWLRCLRLATKRHVDAARARTRFHEELRELNPETLPEIDRLRASDEEATRIWRGVLSGDAEAVSGLIDEIWAEDAGRNTPEKQA